MQLQFLGHWIENIFVVIGNLDDKGALEAPLPFDLYFLEALRTLTIELVVDKNLIQTIPGRPVQAISLAVEDVRL